MDELVRKEIIEKIKRRLNDSYVIVKIGDLVKLVPELSELVKSINEHNEHKELCSGLEKPKNENIVGTNEIITLQELELRLIKAALRKTNGNVDAASKELGISYRNLWRKLEYHHINHNSYAKKVKNSKQI